MCHIIKLGCNNTVLALALISISSFLVCNHVEASENCVIENDMQISLYTAHGKYVAAEKKGGKLIGNRKKLRRWEKFTVITHETGEISLKSFHGKYVAAEKKGGKLIANRKKLRSWEKFTVITHDTGEISLKSFHGKYVAAEKKGGKLIANRKKLRGWEKFTLINHVGNASIVCKKVLTQAEAEAEAEAEDNESETEVEAETDPSNTPFVPVIEPTDHHGRDLDDWMPDLVVLSSGCWMADTALWLMPPIFFGASKVAAVSVAEECLVLSSEAVAVAGAEAGAVIASKLTKGYQDQDGNAQGPSVTVYPSPYKVYPAADIDVKCNIATNFLEHEIPAIACEYRNYLLQIAYTESKLFKAYLTTANSYKELSATDLKDLFHNSWYQWFVGGTDDLDRYLNGIDSPFNADKARWLSTTAVSNQQLIRPLLVEDINNGKQAKNKYFINISFNSDMDESQIVKGLEDYCKNMQARLYGAEYDNCVRRFIRSSTVYKDILSQLDLTYGNLHNISIPSDTYSQGKNSALIFKIGDKLNTAYHQAYYHNQWQRVNTAYIQALANIIASQYRKEILAQYDDKISIDLANKFNNSLKQLIQYINIVELYTALKDLGYSQWPGNTITHAVAEYDQILKVCNLDALCSQHIEIASYYKAAIEDAASEYSATLQLQPILQPIIQGVEKILTLANAMKSWIDQHTYAYANSDESLYERYEEGNTVISFLKTGVEIFQDTSPALAALVYEADGVRIEVHIEAQQQIHFYYVHADGAMEEIAIIGDFLPSLTYDRLQQLRTTVRAEDIKEIIGLFSPLIEDVKRAFQQADLVVEEYTANPDEGYLGDPDDAAANTGADTRWTATYDSDEALLILKNQQLHTTLYWFPNSCHIYLKNPRYISAGFVAEYEISVEISLVLQRIKSSIEQDYLYLLILDERLAKELGSYLYKGRPHKSNNSGNKPRKTYQRITEIPNQSNDTGKQQSNKIKAGNSVKEQNKDEPSLCRAVSPTVMANARGFISAQKAAKESALLGGYKETHKFACFSLAVSPSPNNPNHYTFKRWNLADGINAIWAIDCNMYSDAVGIVPLLGQTQDCTLTSNPQMITVFILVPKATPSQVSFAGAFQDDQQIIRFYGLAPYANNLPDMQFPAAEDLGWYMEIFEAQRMFLRATGLRKVEMVMDYAQNTSEMFADTPVFRGKADVDWFTHRYGVEQAYATALDLAIVNHDETWDQSNIDAWDTGRVTNMASMFLKATIFNGDISGWGTSNVTNMESMFKDATNFNGDISRWKIGKVTNMASMFLKATNFNGDINGWDTSNVNNMESMFKDATNFNGNITDWDTSNVTNMALMFEDAINFNADISGWDTSKVINMESMFNLAESFNGNISGWDTSKVTNMESMFMFAKNFNGDISRWKTGKVTNMGSMFLNAKNFNGDIGDWNTESVEHMEAMFWEASSFNRDLTRWNTSKVTNMSLMFASAENFNGDISGWKTSNVIYMDSMFSHATNFNGDISRWKTRRVTNMDSMFWRATNFNGDISDWKTSHVTNMDSMFFMATNFNGDISDWKTSHVTNMDSMFSFATNFNGDISGWDTGSVANMEKMFFGATSFNGDISGWNTESVDNMEQMFCGALNFNRDISGWKVSKVAEHDRFSEDSALDDDNLPDFVDR